MSQVIRVARGKPPPKHSQTVVDPNTQPPVFVEMQKNMEDELEQRKTDWEKEVEKMQHDFFKLEPGEKRKKYPTIEQSSSGDSNAVALSSASVNSLRPISTMDKRDIFDLSNTKALYTDMPDGSRMFRMRFDVRGFQPEEISVRAEGEKLTVTAENVEGQGEKNKHTRQFNRQVDVPDDVDPDALVSALSPDGILTVEAPAMKLPEKTSADEHQIEPYTFGDHHSQMVDFDRPHQFLDSPTEYTRVIERSFGGGAPRAQPRQNRIKHHVVADSGPVNGGMGKIITPSKYRRAKTEQETPRSRGSEPNVVETDYGKKLRIDVDMGEGYDPEDVHIQLHDYKISVSAKREETVRGRSIRREFSREFDIPEPINKRYFKAKLAKSGRLVMGGSFESNENHEMVLQSLYNDMPIYGTNIKAVDAN